jgi:signal transduction histidine kinase
MRRDPKPAKAKVEAKRPVARKSPKNNDAKVRDLEKRLAEALEREAEAQRRESEALDQQTATAEILAIISGSPTDAQPVFDAIAVNALRLCDAKGAVVVRYDGEHLHVVAHHNVNPEAVERLKRQYPTAPDRHVPMGRAVLDGAVVQVADLQTAVEFSGTVARQFGARGHVAIPLLHRGRAIGAIGISRPTLGPFSDRQIALLKTFADQAVIAIENVRLFKELEARNRDLTEALEQQTATSEILRVISSSPTDVQPIFDAIVRSASRLCGGEYAIVTRYDGELLHLAAQYNPRPGTAEETSKFFPQVPRRETSIVARALVDAAVVHVPDVETEQSEPSAREAHRRIRLRAVVAVPMVHEGRPIGVVSVSRGTPGPFSDRQIALLQTFADQAVIAIENVRLFKELEARNSELTEALEQQTATGEILRVISSSPTDVQPVFDNIGRSAVRLCEARFAAVYRYDGDVLDLASHYNFTPKALAEVRSAFPTRELGGSSVGQAIRERRIVHIHDFESDKLAPTFSQRVARALGYRSMLVVPMLRDEQAAGALVVAHAEAGAFNQRHVELLQTFADQAVIAIENVRLFKELEGANRELEAASQHKSEFLANMSHELRTPLNAIIGFSEVLSERMFGELNEKQEEYSQDIHASGQHLLSLINDILDLSKIEAGRMELERTDFHLPTALDSALTLVRERAGRRNITLRTSVDERLGEVRADERKIRQVVLNLLSNAIKFTPEGGRIEVRAAPVDGSVEVSVSDTGVGIAPEDQEAVFEEFRQVGTADKKVEGTGLGLTLCRKFVELHGGRIWVKSEVGVGSTFTFTIPVLRGE